MTNIIVERIITFMYQRYKDPAKNIIKKNIPKDRFEGSSIGLGAIFYPSTEREKFIFLNTNNEPKINDTPTDKIPAKKICKYLFS